MRLNLVKKRPMVDGPWHGYLMCAPIEAVPYIHGALRLRAAKYWWQEDASVVNGRQAMNETAVEMLTGCGKDIVDAVNRVYMLIDRNENGTNYSFTVDPEADEIEISPPIPTVPPNAALYELPGSKGQTEDMRDMLLNTLTGTPTADYTNPRGTNVVLEDILAALNAETNEETIALLQKIVLTLGGAL